MLPDLKDANLRELSRLASQQRGKARNTQIRSLVDSLLVTEPTPSDPKNASGLKGQNLSTEDTEAFLDWAIPVVEEHIGDDVEIERLFTAILVVHLCNLRMKKEDFHPQKIHVYLSVILDADRSHRESNRSDGASTDEVAEMDEVLEPIVNCGLMWLILADMLTSSNALPLVGLAIEIVSALFVHTRVSHIPEAWEMLLLPCFQTLDKHVEIANELSKTRTAPIYTKFTPTQLSTRLLCDLFGALVYGLRSLSVLDNQNLISMVSSIESFMKPALKYAMMAPSQFNTLQPVALMHAAEILDLVLHQPLDIGNSTKLELWKKRISHLLTIDVNLLTKISIFIKATLSTDDLWENAYSAFDDYEKAEIASLSSDKHRGALPSHIHFLFSCVHSIARSGEHNAKVVAPLNSLRDAFSPLAEVMLSEKLSVELPRGQFLKQSVAETEARMQFSSKGKIHLGWLTPNPLACLVMAAGCLVDPAQKVDVDPAWKLFAFKDAKSDGNEAFEEENFVLALYHYSLALATLGPNSEENLSDRCVCLSNRSQAYLKLLDGTKALENADAALTLDPSHAKSTARREAALEILDKKKKALTELKTEDDGTFSLLPLEQWGGPNWTGVSELLDGSIVPTDDPATQHALLLTEKSRERRKNAHRAQ